MQESLISKIEASRKELLDLGLRNTLLNYKQPASRGIHIVREKSSSVFKLLVDEEKSMSFLGIPAKGGNQLGFDQLDLTEAELEESYSDTKLQTNEPEPSLQKRLLNTYYTSRTSIEEQGINILYISLGMLQWYESESSQDPRLAPLVLIPVYLERSSARDKFSVKYTLEEIGPNISLQAKMKTEFRIQIPDLPELEDFNITAYFQGIKTAIQAQARWTVDEDAIELGFFSFGKFMIYNDLDNNKWPAGKKLIDSPLLQKLFQTGFQEGISAAAEDTFIDTNTDAHKLFQVVDADSSQILSMLAIREGKNLVIQGPPGTGKSQTITNIIADAVGQGKKVLFMAEKMAALEVVKRRLDNINLGEACLELHSHKANKKTMHQELKRILDLGRPNIQRLQENVSLLEKRKTELNEYCKDVNTEIGVSGLTTHKIIGLLINLAEKSEGFVLKGVRLEEFNNWDKEKMSHVEAFSDMIQARLKVIGVPEKLAFWGSGLKVLLPYEQEDLLQTIRIVKQCLKEVLESTETVASEIGITNPATVHEIRLLISITKLASQYPELEGVDIKNPSWLNNQEDIDLILRKGKGLSELYEKYTDVFIPDAWSFDALETRSNLLAHGHKWYKFLISDYNKSNRQLQALCKMPIPKDITLKLKYVDDILEARELLKTVQEKELLVKNIFKDKWRFINSNWPALVSIAHYLGTIHKQITDGLCPKEILEYLLKAPNREIITNNSVNLEERLNIFINKVELLVKKLSFNESQRFAGRSLLEQPLGELVLLIEEWAMKFNELHQVISWNNLLDSAAEEKVGFLTDIAQSWEFAPVFLKASIQKSWYEFLLEKATMDFISLRKFQRDSHEEIIEQFRKLDILNLQFNRGKVALEHWENVPRMDAGGQVNILKREFNKKARLKPIRKVIEEAGMAIQAIKPVFMMSPLSIANFLPPGSVEFDLLIFDEASQVKPVDAIGAILRAKQLVVVGDTKQLPPTSFFDSLTKEIDEEEDNVTADMQSILGMCESQGLIPKMLRWHYRSRHESLITLSNFHFYENKLVVFPSPGSKYHMGLKFHHLKDTFYDRGKTRTNPKEAEYVVDAIIDHASRFPKLTLGVAAFSSAQRQAIQDVLEVRRRRHPELEAYFNNHSHEPFFIKNLENVQGDERDVIFISIGYGRSQEGYVAMSFGPLNNEGGERRLNVLITRAKLRCEVFTNITSDDIDLNRTKQYGIRVLKEFLYFAQHGKLNITEETGFPADSPFEENVADKLARLGYIVRKQVGSQGFYIDLAIVDPENPGRYLLGIECDGAAYHSARSARDRDRLRQQVLENIGWRIHRIWSTDWFKYPERELKRTVEAIEKAHEILHIDDIAFENDLANDILPVFEREDVRKEDVNIPLYEIKRPLVQITGQDLHEYPVGQLAKWVEEVVLVESPVHFDEVARRIVEAHGIMKVGSRIRLALFKASKYSQSEHKIEIKGDFLWWHEMTAPQIRNRANLSYSSRKLKYISPEELHLAIRKTVQEAIAISPESALVIIANTLGFGRVSEEIKLEIEKSITEAVQKKIVILEGGFLKLENSQSA